MIKFPCPGCQALFNVTDDKAGKRGKCPKCQSPFTIPQPEAAAAAPPPPAKPDPNIPVEIEPCPGCQAVLTVAAEFMGADVECPNCNTVFIATKPGAKPKPKPKAPVAPPPTAPEPESAFSGFGEGGGNDEEEAPKPKKGKSKAKVELNDDAQEDDAPKAKKKSRDEEYDDEDEFSPSRAARKKRASANPFHKITRFVSPGPFLLLTFLFFLPWTDLSCNTKEFGNQQFVTQSGFQAASGGYSEGSALAQVKGDRKATKPGDAKSEKEPEKAFLLWLYLLLLVAGLGLPIALGNIRWRGLSVVGLAGLAAMILGVQTIIGLPLSKAAAEMKQEQEKEMKAVKAAGASGPSASPEVAVQSSFLISFYLTVLVLLATGAFGLVQVLLGGFGTKPKPAKKQRIVRDDDESKDAPEEEEEAPPPPPKKQSKKKIVEEDEEEEAPPPPPKKQSKKKIVEEDEDDFPMPAAEAAPSGGNAFAFDEGEEAPKPKRKKPRRDDDD